MITCTYIVLIFTQNECTVTVIIKGIVSVILTTSFYGMNQKIYTHKKKSLLPKFQLIPILSFQVMHDYVCFIAPIDYCVE